MERIHNTNEEEIILEDYEQRELALKPRGLWYGIDGDWIDWCKYNMPGWVKKNNFIIEINEDKILKIQNKENVLWFNNKFKPEGIEFIKEINWQKVAKNYCGIEIINYQRCDCFMLWYSGWDCNSGLIWNKEAIKSITKL